MADQLADTILPPRRAAAKASASFSEQLSDSESDDSGRKPKRGKGNAKRRKKVGKGPTERASTRPNPISRNISSESNKFQSKQLIGAALPRVNPSRKSSKPHSQQDGCQNTDDDFNSDLTPLSSPNCSQSFVRNTSLERSVSQKRPYSPVAGSSHSPDILRRSLEANGKKWDAFDLGAYIWVLLDRHAHVFEPGTSDPHDRNKEWLWWPGKVKIETPSLNSPLQVTLFGSTATKVQNVKIHTPTEDNILPLEDSHQRTRFDFPTYFRHPVAEDVLMSPSKKQKQDWGDVEDRWRTAVAELMQDKEAEEGSDVMPEVWTLGFTASPNRNDKDLGKTKSKSHSDLQGDLGVVSPAIFDDDRWSPPPPDITLQIPGEVVLARERRKSIRLYWPAKILAYIPPDKPRKEGKYRVEFLDTTIEDLPRSSFYSAEEDGFATCPIGNWTSDVVEVLNDEEEAEENPYPNPRRAQSPSPSPLEHPPPPDVFKALSIREQFVYTKPVLTAVLNRTYPPAFTTHAAFISGGRAREGVVKLAGLRGTMDPREVHKLQAYVSEWCLRDERRGQLINADEATDATFDKGKVPSGQEARGQGFNDLEIIEDVNDRASSLAPTDHMSSPREEPAESSFAPSERSTCLSENDYIGATNQVENGSTASGDDVDSHKIDGKMPSRQYGCESYEALAPVEKVDYCLNVLLPEAIRQILLWRTGHRTSIQLLSDQEEQHLYDKGEELLRQKDWVFDVVRLRKVKTKQLGKTFDSADNDGIRYTETGRPRRAVNAPKSYQE